jgi:hypothetical protein
MADILSQLGGMAVPFTGTQSSNTSNNSDAQGRRVRLRPKPAAAMQVYGSNGLLQPLRNTNGMVWPYQPVITWAQGVNYSPMELVHTNQDIQAYVNTPSTKLQVAGDFSVQNQQDGIYALAAIHFLRTVTKMHFGSSDPNAGVPPPVLLFDAYGQYMFNQLPVIVTNFTVSLPNDVDYVPVDLSNIQTYSGNQTTTNIPGYSQLQVTPSINSFINSANSTLIATRMYKQDLTNVNDGYIWLPSVFNIMVDITVQNTATRLRSFNLDSFRTGKLMTQGRWI